MASLSSFWNCHRDGTFVVCGCGESLRDLVHPERFITIGVNDVGRLFQPKYLVVLNPREQFSGDRFRYVETSQAEYLFTQLDLGITHSNNIVNFRLGRYCGTDFCDPNVLHYAQNSPYVALCLAIHMGAKWIGLIGVDFTDNHFFGQTGPHPLVSQFGSIDTEYRQLGDAVRALGIEIFNLSRVSRLTAFPTMTVEQFAAVAGPDAQAGLGLRVAEGGQSLKIVSYSVTPVAGVPAILARCIDACTDHRCRCVWAQNGYGNGVVFEGGIQWTESPAEAEAALADADLVIVHNGKAEPRHRGLLTGKAVITMAHNYMWNVDQTFVAQDFPGVVVGQYQATLKEFEDWSVVPNPIPLWEPTFQPGTKDSVVTICYAPSGKDECYPMDHRLYWHSKGYDSTMRVLDRLERRLPIRLEVIRDRQVSHAEAMVMKRRAHIVIDECVTGSYHRSSLEGLATGCVVVNGVGQLPAVLNVFRYCSHDEAVMPFVSASLDRLESRLTCLIERGTEALTAQGVRNRQWMEQHWDFRIQWQRFWEPVIPYAMHGPGHRASTIPSSLVKGSQTAGQCASEGSDIEIQEEGVSVVVCHGGRDRLPYLAASLANLRQCRGISEIIVVDMGASPCAQDVARRWADKYVFVYNAGLFERARALNIGTGLAEYDLVLWKDNDLIVPCDFVCKAALEMRSKRLDYLVPFTSISYLSEADSKEVISGTRNPADCKPVNVYDCRYVTGGAGLVRKAFIIQYGGMGEDFRGWGGEDDAWTYKASLLGRSSVTGHLDQLLYHLFHTHSGGYGGRSHIANNPHYAENVALLNAMRAIRDPTQFVMRFPPPRYASCPFDRTNRIAFVVDDSMDESRHPAEAVARWVREMYGMCFDWLSLADISEAAKTSTRGPECVVLFTSRVAMRYLSSAALEPLWPKTVVVLDESIQLSVQELHRLTLLGAVVTCNSTTARELEKTGLDASVWSLGRGEQTNAAKIALVLIQAMSLIMGGGRRPRACPMTGRAVSEKGDNGMTVPVWMYWEDDCPAWIKACRETIMAHGCDVRLLDPEAFNALRDIDRDIDLIRLQPAHRADYIRAFLLSRHGGLWIDSDCLVMQSLSPILEKVYEHDFVAHRERSGYVSNGFIGARPGSRIANAFYRRVCDILRSGRSLGWISLGGQPLTETLQTAGVEWYEIECDRIQPICWSNPGAFFEIGPVEEHERVFDKDAICYMLSNTAIQKFQIANPSRDLLADGTFFRYLLRKALGATESASCAGGTSTYTDSWKQIPFGMEVIAAIAPKRVLDVGIGFGRWGMLIREFCEQRNGRHRDDWQVHVEGMTAASESDGCCQRVFYDEVHTFDLTKIIEMISGSWDLVIFGDVLQQWPKEIRAKALAKALVVSDYVLVNVPLGSKSVIKSTCPETSGARWEPDDVLQFDPVRSSIFGEGKGAEDGAFLFSRSDPKQLRGETPMARVFDKMFRDNLRVGDESVSGPGSCLAQTTEIRQRLPLLLENLKVRSILDAPCGDFNWMKHVHLGIDQYIGADIVPQLINQNRQKFSGEARNFILLDLTRHALPRVDLILCRDCLVHFAFEDVFLAIKSFRKSGSIYILMTTFPGLRANAETVTGNWRPLNFELAPFNFPPPLRLINEKCTEAGGRYSDKSLGLWRLEELRVTD